MSESKDSYKSDLPHVSAAQLCWLGFTTFIVRSYKDIVYNFVLTLAPPAVTTALYLIVFGSFMGERIGKLDGISYLQFMAPGLIMLPIVTASYSQTGLSFVVAKLFRTIDEHLVSPQPGWMIVVSYVAGGMMRGTLVGAAAGIVTLLFTRSGVVHPAMLIGTLLLVSLISSIAGFINGLFAHSLEQVHWVPSFVLTPLTYFGGVFYSVTLLPSWARDLSLSNPVFYMVNVLRFSMFGVSDVQSSGIILLVVAFVTFSMLLVAASLIARGVGIRD